MYKIPNPNFPFLRKSKTSKFKVLNVVKLPSIPTIINNLKICGSISVLLIASPNSKPIMKQPIILDVNVPSIDNAKKCFAPIEIKYLSRAPIPPPKNIAIIFKNMRKNFPTKQIKSS